MSGNNRDFRPRPGPAPKLIEGPRVGQRSLYRQQVLDEDSYTDALSHIITRDFFPNLPHIHATNAYLSALTNNDPELLSSSIRRLAQLAQEKEDGVRGSRRNASSSELDAAASAAEEFRNMHTPHISLARTPVGARGWDTPRMDDRGRRRRGGSVDSQLDGPEDAESSTTGAVGAGGKRRKIQPRPVNRIRDDLSLDAFQRNYTSEDNASFVQIVAAENKQRKEDRWGWAWEAQAKAEQRKIEWEGKRQAVLEAATSGQWVVDGNGRRMIGGLAQGGSEEKEGKAWSGEGPKLLSHAAAGKGGVASEQQTAQGMISDRSASGGTSNALVKQASSSTSTALVLSKHSSTLSAKDEEKLDEVILPEHHPLGRALVEAGLPATALISKEDGVLVPMRETASGYGEGRGRGQDEVDRRKAAEKAVLGDEEKSHLALGGSGAEGWGFKTRNNLYFPADANEDPYPKPSVRPSTSATSATSLQPAPSISYANTRMRDEEEVGPAYGSGLRSGVSGGSSRRGSSPARSWVDAAVKGTPYVPRDQRGSGFRTGTAGGNDVNGMPTIGDYPLLPEDPSPEPEGLPSLLTWGTLMSTPRALDGHSDSGDPLDATPSFRLPNTKRRDEIARKLGDKASRAMHERAKGFTPKPRYHSGSSGGGGEGGLSETLRAAAERSRGKTPSRTPGSVRGGGGGSMAPPAMTPKRSDLSSAGKKLLERSLGRTPGPGGLALGSGSGGLSGVKRAVGSSASRAGWTPK